MTPPPQFVHIYLAWVAFQNLLRYIGQILWMESHTFPNYLQFFTKKNMKREFSFASNLNLQCRNAQVCTKMSLLPKF